jgi:hypothetical protein
MSDVTNRRPELQVDTLELINNELTARLDRQAEARARIDTKAALLSGIPKVLFVTGRQPGAGPGRGGIKHLAG